MPLVLLNIFNSPNILGSCWFSSLLFLTLGKGRRVSSSKASSSHCCPVCLDPYTEQHCAVCHAYKRHLGRRYWGHTRWYHPTGHVHRVTRSLLWEDPLSETGHILMKLTVWELTEKNLTVWRGSLKSFIPASNLVPYWFACRHCMSAQRPLFTIPFPFHHWPDCLILNFLVSKLLQLFSSCEILSGLCVL